MRTFKSRATGAAAAAAVALAVLNQPALAGTRYNNDAAAAAAALAIFGTFAAIIAANRHRDVYHRRGPVHVPRGRHWHRLHRR